MATSYISERSAELSLVPQLKLELEKYFDYVAPLFPWLNRETSLLSRQIHINDSFKILILFSRRPKINFSDKSEIFATINEDLYLFHEFAKKHNVPVIAGCPIATNFWELSKSTNHVWIEINKKTISNYLNLVSSYNGKKVISSITVSKIVSLINRSPAFGIKEFFDFLQESKDVMPRHFVFGSRYKPLYLLIKTC